MYRAVCRLLLFFGAAVVAPATAWLVTEPCSTAYANEASSTVDVQHVARVITAFELTRRHVKEWESNAAAKALVTQMMDDFVSQAGLNIRWQARFLLIAESEPGPKPDEFESRAISRLRAADGAEQQVWSEDQKRSVFVLTARKSCTNCHQATAGEVMGYVSLQLLNRQ